MYHTRTVNCLVVLPHYRLTSDIGQAIPWSVDTLDARDSTCCRPAVGILHQQQQCTVQADIPRMLELIHRLQ